MAVTPLRTGLSPDPRKSTTGQSGDTDIAIVGAMFADPRRCRILLALDDGRALPARQLAAEAGVTPAPASSHLAKMVGVGLLSVETRGRNRYYHITGPQIGRVMELLSELAPTAPIRSLRQGVRAEMLREARTCYDHLAGQLGVAVMTSMLEDGHLSTDQPLHADERYCPPRCGTNDVHYWLTSGGERFLTEFGVSLPARVAIKHCVDWSERRHHLSGVVGRRVLERLFALAWMQRSPGSRAVTMTVSGRRGMMDTFGVSLTSDTPRQP